MANKRIKDLSTTAAVTASDDFIAVDGATNGTRKLDAYSPTFGGNLTVNGTANLTGIVTTNSSTGYTTFGGRVVINDSSGIRGTSSTIGLFSASGVAYFGNYDSATGLKITLSTGAAEFTNNLTVSGTGTTALGGAGSIISLSASGRLQLGFTYSRVADPDGAGGWLGGYNIKFSTSPKYDATGATAGLYYSSNGVRIYSGGTAVADTAAPLVATFATNGNLLLGTTTDSGNGKLQLATHTTSAGGIGFGTDQTIYRYSSTVMGLAGVTDLFIQGGNAGLWLGTSAGGYQVGIARSSSDLTFYTGSAGLALTLDISQRMLTTGNAAFGGTTFVNATQWTAGSSGFGANGFDKTVIGYLKSSTNGATIAGHNEYLSAWANLNIAGNNLYFRTNGETVALTLDSSYNATFGGNIKTAAPSGGTAATWRLGTVASVSPTSPNRTIEVEIGGTTYYIHAKTTNN